MEDLFGVPLSPPVVALRLLWPILNRRQPSEAALRAKYEVRTVTVGLTGSANNTYLEINPSFRLDSVSVKLEVNEFSKVAVGDLRQW